MSAHHSLTPLAIGIRAWQRPERTQRTKRSQRASVRASRFTFVFDTETTTDSGQRLRVGCFRILRDRELIQEGLFYDCVTEEELELLGAVVEASPGLVVLGMGEFRRFLFHYVYRLRATVVGHNLPFDLTRLAVEWSPARGRFLGGVSLTLWPRTDGEGENRFRPRLRLKTLNNRASLIEFAATAKDERGGGFWPGRFIDTRTLAAALTDQSLSLERAAEIFGTEHRKLGNIRHGQPLTRRYIRYLRRDVLVTEELYWKLSDEYMRHPIDLDPSRAYSSASIAKAYLRAFGITPPLERSTVPEEVLGYVVSAFYGGRVECRIRKQLVPVTYLDVRSTYPSAFTLLDLQRFLIAGDLSCREATDEIRQLTESLTLDDLFDPAVWPRLGAICEVEPDGDDILPVRAKYGLKGGRSIGLNYLASARPLWFSLPDVIASKLLTGKLPEIRRAIVFGAGGKLPDLRAVALAGEVRIDPRRDQIFKRVVEERERILRNHALPDAEREARQRGLKTFGNGGSYGIFAELNRQEPTAKEKRVRVLADREFATTTKAEELPGRYCYPPLAVLITGAARLLLAMLEAAVSERGGAYAFCDTDSMAVVTDCSELEPNAEAKELSRREDALALEEIKGIVRRFKRLCPYESGGSLFKFEPENFAAEDSKRRKAGCREALYAWVVSAKRYVLLNLDPYGGWVIRRASEHGLGSYLDPGSGNDEWMEQ